MGVIMTDFDRTTTQLREDNLSQKEAGRLLEQAMREAGYHSDEALADAVDSVRTNIQKIRTGQSGGSPEMWYKISQAVNFPFEIFMRVLVGLPTGPIDELDPEAWVYARDFHQLDPEEREVVKHITRLYLRRKADRQTRQDQAILDRIQSEMTEEAAANLASEQALREVERRATNNTEERKM